VILAIDQGTTGTTCLLLEGAHVVARAHREIPQHFPRPGWVEHDPEALLTSVLECIRELRPAAVEAIGITNQRETVVLWDRHTLRAVAPAIVWQCRRTADACERMREQGCEERLRELTGLVVDPYFSATKLAWLLDSDAALRARAGRGELAFGTVDSWLVARLTGGRVHATDPSNASRTQLCNLRGEWDEELLDLFGVPRALLPEIRPSSGDFGRADPATTAGVGAPITGVAGDQQAALFGQACFEPGMAKNTYGTGSFLLVNTGHKPVPSRAGLTTIAWDLGDGPTYALEGSVFISGAALQWLRDGLGIIADASEAGPMSEATADTGGVYFVPALTGLGAPHWDPAARGLICGLTRGTAREHLVRAAVEAMAYQTRDVAEALSTDMGAPLREVRVDGGASVMDFLLRFQADQLRVAVVRGSVSETTALGAGALAALGVGAWASPAEFGAAWAEAGRFEPSGSPAAADALHAGWRRALALSRGLAAPA
jgi:glycerol kinase